MTQEQFDKYSFGYGDKLLWRGGEYEVAGVDFEEDLIAIKYNPDSDDLTWVRFENVEMIKTNNP